MDAEDLALIPHYIKANGRAASYDKKGVQIIKSSM